MEKRKMSKETLCWTCQNFSKCSWSEGVPINGWKAKPTKVKNKNENGILTHIDSFLVEKCPEYEKDKMYKTTMKYIQKKYPIGIEINSRTIRSPKTLKKLYDKYKIKIQIYDYCIYIEEHKE